MLNFLAILSCTLDPGYFVYTIKYQRFIDPFFKFIFQDRFSAYVRFTLGVKSREYKRRLLNFYPNQLALGSLYAAKAGRRENRIFIKNKSKFAFGLKWLIKCTVIFRKCMYTRTN